MIELTQAPATPVWPPQNPDKQPRTVRMIPGPSGKPRAESLSEIAAAEKITFDKLIELNFGVTKGNPSGDRWARIINWYLKNKLNAAPMADGNFRFNGGETIYVPKTAEPPKAGEPPKPVDPLTVQALDDVKAFGERAGVAKFAAFKDRRAFAVALAERVADPSKINQGHVGLCPSASVLYALAKSNVLAYARLVIDLYERGEATLNGWRIKPCQELLDFPLPVGVTAPVDWVPMASIRDSENWFIDYQNNTDWFSGAQGNEVMRWLRLAGYTTVIDGFRYVGNASPINLRRANELYKTNHQVLMLVNGGIVQPVPRTGFIRSPIATHWIAMASPLQFGGDADGDETVTFTAYTWGALQSVPATGPIKTTVFLRSYFGFVACRF